MKANELKKGDSIRHNKKIWKVVHTEKELVIIQRRQLTKAFKSNPFLKIFEKELNPNERIELYENHI